MTETDERGFLRDVAERAVSRVTCRLRPGDGPIEPRSAADRSRDGEVEADGRVESAGGIDPRSPETADDTPGERASDPGPVQDAIEIDRRRFVQFAAAGATVGVAGCGTGDDAGSTETDEMGDDSGDAGMTDSGMGDETADGGMDGGMTEGGMTEGGMNDGTTTSGMDGEMTEGEMGGGMTETGMGSEMTEGGMGGEMTDTSTDDGAGPGGMDGDETTASGTGSATNETTGDGASTDSGMN